jgi:hypothetical protein
MIADLFISQKKKKKEGREGGTLQPLPQKFFYEPLQLGILQEHYKHHNPPPSHPLPQLEFIFLIVFCIG